MITSFTGEYAFLSNFFYTGIDYEGAFYPSAEHAYQAAKTLNPKRRLEIAEAQTPGEAKRKGRTLIDIRPNWDEIKVDVMRDILRLKFSRTGLRERLIATGNESLYEGNFWGDRFWGVSVSTTESGEVITVGENMLGRLLMQIRAELRDEISYHPV